MKRPAPRKTGIESGRSLQAYQICRLRRVIAGAAVGDRNSKSASRARTRRHCGNANCSLACRAEFTEFAAVDSTARQAPANRPYRHPLPIDSRRISNSIIFFNSHQFEHFTDPSGNNCTRFSIDYSRVFKIIIDFSFTRTLESPTKAYVSFSSPYTIHFLRHAVAPAEAVIHASPGGVSFRFSIPEFNRAPVIPPNSPRITPGLSRAFI
ncbi:hypothetical protein [Burkholderia sp. Bp8998]|uniref:hypothetical protein n=1 Tax=Burkholderia sp. Bp8998 TaxID=2184557 RepID=UPI000F59CA64|nr:hypothetical protein [Burkholderia sp. Bp8998]